MQTKIPERMVRSKQQLATQRRIQGVIPIIQTPFLPSEQLDLTSLQHEVEFISESEADGMVFPGYASEWWKLSDFEMLRAAEVILKSRSSKCPVIFNVVAQSTLLAKEQARQFASLGCDALMCLPPFVLPASQRQVLDHLSAIMEVSTLPHILQYAPGLTGTRFNPADLAGLHERFPHFCCIKIDFAPSGLQLTALKSELGHRDFTYLVGYSGIQLLDSIRRGADGLMGGVGHLRQDIAMLKALQTGDAQAGYNAFATMLPMLNFEMQSIDLLVSAHKKLLQEQGILTHDVCRGPWQPLDSFQEAELAVHWKAISQSAKAYGSTEI
jgi:dihydrodipicolinate synthase/N-acetylneuraminate lyase